ncbi:MAG: hypothetical protein KF746_07940 [Chitinophagaceae bacterium]|nr:hypothetical protein [Chitinophagaceae bacterium]
MKKVTEKAKGLLVKAERIYASKNGITRAIDEHHCDFRYGSSLGALLNTKICFLNHCF